MRNKSNLIEKTVIEYFIRMTKKHHLYYKFRESVNGNGVFELFVRKKRTHDNPLSLSKNIDELASALNKLTASMSRQMRKKDDKYEYITMNINHLLHFCIEPHGVRMETLCLLGEEIFNLTCSALYGDEFAANAHQDDLSTINDPVALKSKIFQDYVHDMNEGKINMTFDEYWKLRSGEIDEWMETHTTDEFLADSQMPQPQNDDDIFPFGNEDGLASDFDGEDDGYEDLDDFFEDLDA